MRTLTKIQGEELAKTLLHELTPSVLTVAGVKTRQVKRLLDVPPTRDDLAFYKKDEEDAPKLVLRDSDIVSDLFCMSHGDYTLQSGTDIDHATPFAVMRVRQEKLLDFLNSKDINLEFLNGFLHCTEQNKSLDTISDYFQCDAKDKKIKGTWYFHKLCYNDIENLTLMCHACNICKNSTDLITWLAHDDQEPFFGKAFLKDVEQCGGVYDGVILQKVCKPSLQPLSLFDKYRIKVNLAGYLEYTYYVTSIEYVEIGLGRYVREWYYSRNQKFFEEQEDTFLRVSQVLRAELVDSLQARAHGDELAFTRLMRKFSQQTTEIVGLIAAMKDFFLQKIRDSSVESSSSSDDSQEAQMRQDQSRQEAVARNFKMHSMKKIKRFLENILDIPPDDFKSLWNQYSQQWVTNQSYDAVDHMCTDLFNKLMDKLLEQKKQIPDSKKIQITIPALEEILKTVYETHARANITVTQLAAKDETIAAKDEKIAAKDETIAALEAKIGQLQKRTRDNNDPSNDDDKPSKPSDSSFLFKV